MQKSFFLTALIMFAFWLLLSGDFHFIPVFLGIVSSIIVAMAFHNYLLGKVELKTEFMRTLRLLLYLPWLFWQIFIANLQLMYLILHPAMPIEPQVITFDTELETDMGIVILANSITLTPGTVTIEANREKFVIHAITPNHAEGVLSGKMQAKVKEIEG